MDIAINVQNLTKTYRKGFWLNETVSSLVNCSLEVPTGVTFGLLGPNGAGKTTLLKILLGIIRPSQGSGTVLGFPLGERLAKEQIGYLPENAYYYDYLTGWELLEFMGSLLGVKERTKRIDELLDLVGLSQSAARKKKLKEYSKGMVQRIGIAQALINDPQLVFLDEPMSGLDPLGRYQIREIIQGLHKQGKTVFFNSHILSDAEAICDYVGILNHGHLVAIGALQDLLGVEETYHVRGRGGNPDRIGQFLTNLEWHGDSWQGLLSQPPAEFCHTIAADQGTIVSITMARQNLEEFFIQKIREGIPQ
ncbi:MAG: multidrug ABC transporter ATP-binding protein [Cyanobacteria bacterium M5B4]|nr:MAG: multidrug ABC transporter ATP-binding protein [Cyanobacteria bacterium M5B4]